MVMCTERRESVLLKQQDMKMLLTADTKKEHMNLNRVYGNTESSVNSLTHIDF